MSLTLNTLGRLEIYWDGQPASGLTLRKSRALLIYLALNPGSHDRSHLAGLLWGEMPEKNARRNLRHALHRLRSALAPEVLRSNRLSAGLNPNVPAQVDALVFETLIVHADHCQLNEDFAAAAAHLETAVELYQGDFLIGFDIADCLEFQNWLIRCRARMREQALDALDTLVWHWIHHGAHERALDHARRTLALEPLWEKSHRQMMMLLALTGQRSAALAQYQACCSVLEAELGLKPLEETTALYDRLVDWETGRSADWETGGPADQSAALPTYQPTDLPLTGRREEHAALVKSWEVSQRDAGKMVLVAGEAGVGKTRLMEEVLRYTETQGTTVLRGHCYEFGGSLPYQPIAQALRGCLNETVEAQGGRGELSKSTSTPRALHGLSPVWLSELARLIPELHKAYPDLPRAQSTADRTARQRLFEAVTRLLLIQSPACLFFDDLHWADQSTLDLLHYVARHLVKAPIWLVGTYRPEEVGSSHPLTRLRQGLSRDHRVEQLTLKPLSDTSVHALSRYLVGEQESAALGDLLYRESAGNPFILVETISDLQEQGALVASDTAHLTHGDRSPRWSWSGPPAREILPISVQDVVLQRVGRLSQTAQRLLNLAAVIGQPFDTALLHAAAGRDGDAVEESLNEWLARRLIQQPQRPPLSSSQLSASRFSLKFQYDFSHDKIRAVVYHAIEQEQRRRLHRRVGEALEQLFPEQVDQHVETLAYHWEHAGDAEKTIEYLMRAGDKARRVYAHGEAAEYYRRALALLESQEGARQGARTQTLMKLGLTYHQAFKYREAHQAYEEGFDLWQQRGKEQPTVPLLTPPQTLRVRWLEPTTLDPGLSPDNHTSSLLTQLFSGLVALSPEMNIVPDVALTWDISEDGRRYVFHLRDDVRWSDGVPVTAHDFEYAWKRVLDPDTDSPSAGFLYDIQGAQAFHQGHGCRDAVGVEAQDETTLLVELEEPTGYFLQLLVRPDYSPVPRHVVEVHGAGWTEPAHFVTNGPFHLEAWHRGERVVLARNADYHGLFRGNVERVILFPITDWSARFQLYENGTLDLLGIGFCPPDKRQAVQARHAGESILLPVLETCYLIFDVRRPPFDDVRVRRAFTLATDRAALVEEVLQGYAAPATGGLLPQGMPGHSPDIGLPYDPEQARHLLTSAGYPEGRGFPVVDALAFDAVEARGAHLMSQWQETLGVKIIWQTPKWATFVDRLKHEPYHLIYAMWVADYPDPDNFMRVSRAEIWPNWHNGRYERLVSEAGRVMDQEERLNLYRQADEILVTEVPLLNLTYAQEHLLIKPWVRHYPVASSKTVFWKDVVIEPHK